MREEVSLTKLVPGTVVGTIIGGVILFLGYREYIQSTNAALLAGGGIPDPTMLLLFMAGGLFVGGLAAALLVKGGKESLTKCVLSSLVAGLLISVLFTVLAFLQIPAEAAAMLTENDVFLLEAVMVFFAMSFMFLSVLGGLVGAIVTKSTDSFLIDVLKETRKALTVKMLVPFLVFLFAPTAILFGLSFVASDFLAAGSDPELYVLGITLGLMILYLGFTAFAITGVIDGMLKKKKTMQEAFVDAIKQSKQVLVSTFLFLALVPIVLTIILPMLQLSYMWVMALVWMYLIFVSFSSVVAFTKKKYVYCAADSIDFVKKNFLPVLTFYPTITTGFVLVGGLIALLPLGGLGEAGEITSGLLMSGVVALFLFVLIASQTAFYSKLSEGNK
ncbi:hypothetical protein K8R43_05415 [archaeon]|nr:hypothetical protein [archaeon]